eukprot:GEMP01004526.1.p1 GENE.GEMP01004526.1~~GEMP01004526.1.p1  ORF type:complete len:1110 (+),score=304.38 GEMP01004526.1:435-3764(+)
MCSSLRALTVHVNNCATSGEWRKALHALHRALRSTAPATAWPEKDDATRERKSVATLDARTSDSAIIGNDESSRSGQRTVTSGNTHGRIEVDTRLCNAVLHACAHAGMWQQCLLLMRDWQHKRGMWQFAGSARPDVVSYTLVIRALSREKNNEVWEQGLRLLRTMKRYDVVPNVRTYNALLALLAKTRQWHAALDLLRTMSTASSGRSVGASSNSSSSREVPAGNASSREKQTCSVVPDIVSYNTVLHALSTGRQWKVALDLLRAMSSSRCQIQTKDGGVDQVHPTVVSFTSVISACGKEGEWREALTLRDDMARCGIRPNLLTYNALISACEKGGQWQAAVEIFNELRASAEQPRQHRDDDTREFTLVNDNVQKHRRERQDMVFATNRAETTSGSDQRGVPARMQGKATQHNCDVAVAPDVISYNALISALAKGQQWERALALLHTMQSCDHASPAPDVISYSAAITACAAAAQWRPAVDLLYSMQHRNGIRPNVFAYNATMTACEKGGGQWQEALRVLHSMPPNMADTISYNACISALQKGKGANWSIALQLLNTMKENSVAFTVISLNAMLSVLGNQGLWQRALDLLVAMENGEYEGVKPDTISYNAVMTACEKRRMWHGALELLARMQEPGRPRPDVISYNACISACEKGGNWRMALQLFHSMGNFDMEPDVVTLSAVISALARDGGQWCKALELLESFGTRNLVADVVTYNAAITACSKGAQWTHALNLLCRMESLHIQPNVISCNAAFAAIYAAMSHAMSASSVAVSTDCAPRGNDAGVPHGTQSSTYYIDSTTQQCVDGIGCVERILALMSRQLIAPDALGYATAIDIARTCASQRADVIVDRLVAGATSSASTWIAHGGVVGAAHFAKTPYDVIHLYQVLQQCSSGAEKMLAAPVRDLVFTQAYPALRRGDTVALQELALPNAGPLTRELLDRLDLHPFDATHARAQVCTAGAPSRSLDVTAKEVVAHIRYARKTSRAMVGRVVWYGGHCSEGRFPASTTTRKEGRTGSQDDAHEAAQRDDPLPVKKMSVDNRRLPSIYLNHDRSLHAERQALLQSIDHAEGVVELYITHRPCLSCIAAMVTFKNTAHVELKVAFDELDCA